MDIFVQKSEPRMVAMLLIAIVFLLSTAQIIYLLWPQIKQYRELHQSYQVLQNAAGSSMGLEQQLLKTRDDIKQLSYQLHGDMAGLPDRQMESYIIGRLQKISWESDVELASVIPGKGKQVQMFQETLFDVKINASYFNFFKWLQSISDELGYIVVKKFEIHPVGTQTEQDSKLGISLTLVSYRMVKHAS